MDKSIGLEFKYKHVERGGIFRYEDCSVPRQVTVDVFVLRKGSVL
jgi:hypothetical protein